MQKKSSANGVLLVNLGSPDAPEKKALRRYLKQFLSDPRVIEPKSARWVWLLILNGIILNRRPSESAELYRGIWDYYGEGTGSPLLHISKQQCQALQQRLTATDKTVHVDLAMTYGRPSIDQALDRLYQKNIEQLIILPLYPQYSATTVGSVFDAVTKALQNRRYIPRTTFINQYHNHPKYIQALKKTVIEHQQQHGQPDQLIMSFHGVPKRYIDNGDPYSRYCLETATLLAQALKLQQSDYQVTFQSVFGREEWLKPYTDATLKQLPKQNCRHVQVICPGFAADCLETLEEIAVENKKYFTAAGGQKFSYIPALNHRPDHIDCLSELILSHLTPL